MEVDLRRGGCPKWRGNLSPSSSLHTVLGTRVFRFHVHLCIFNLLPSLVPLKLSLYSLWLLTQVGIFTRKHDTQENRWLRAQLCFYRNRCCLLLKNFCQYFIIKKQAFSYKVWHAPFFQFIELAQFKGCHALEDLLWHVWDTIREECRLENKNTERAINDLHLRRSHSCL